MPIVTETETGREGIENSKIKFPAVKGSSQETEDKDPPRLMKCGLDEPKKI